MMKTFLRSKTLLSALILLLGIGMVNAQQLPHSSQYMFNDYAINPAVAGAEKLSFASLSYRAQWAGFEGAPTTSRASFHTAFQEHVGLGGSIFTDKNGPFRRSGLRGSYAYQLRVGDSARLGFGLAGTLYQHRLDQGALRPEVEGDPALVENDRKSLDPDATFGIYWKGKDHFVTAAASNLFQSEMFGDSLGGTGLSRHYFIGGGYGFQVSDRWSVEPSMMLRKVKAAPFHYDVNAKLIYDEMIWGGLSYRSSDAVLALIGLKKGQLRIAYSYDLTLSEVRRYSSGSHEIHLGMRIPRGSSPEMPSF